MVGIIKYKSVSGKIGVALTIFLAVSASTYFFSDVVRAKVQTVIGDDVGSDEFVTIVLEPWETANQVWPAIAKPELGETYATTQIIKGSPRDLVRPWHKQDTNVLALAFHFVFPGFNEVTLEPPRPQAMPKTCPGPKSDLYCVERITQEVDSNGNTLKNVVYGLEIPGIARKVSIWVCGRGNEYDLEGWIMDWKGNTQIYQFGSVDFIGWRPMTISIPENVPQDVDSYPQSKTLVFQKLVIRSTPKTSGEKVYLFLDELKVLTNVFEVNFDGVMLSFPKKTITNANQKSINIEDGDRKNRIADLIKIYRDRSERK